MQTVFVFLDQLWNLRWVTGHRTQVAQRCLQATAALVAYQGIATSADLIKAGLNAPDLPPNLLLLLSALAGYFGTKVAQFSREHQP